jgi:hypothetical protein
MAEERNSVDVVRISVLREYLSVSENLSSTPVPFAEFRIYQFRKTMPQGVYLHIVRNMLKVELERLEKLFQSIDLVKNKLPMLGKDVIKWKDREEENLIQARRLKEGDKPFLSVDGLEIEAVDANEVLQFFKKFAKRVKLNFIYRYVCFYNPDGSIRKEYGEEEIREIESTIGAEAFFDEFG